ncbi:hypothetical protein [Solidesulfovibrio carbinolicus]|uniref:Uncharacterized protein n=1 Tax=Solidesulfovibrio carbinolicus TaxID=296842 RepID=A0A4P6HJZ8_9BACT|nr:hypothetical protein [Solidesulfovibrio carbinolicus]QAZ66804.1 hypothetical protein C3Y92_05925 [Solidesulfovibrio carbinolicus]
MNIQFKLADLDNSKLPLFNKPGSEPYPDSAYVVLDSSDKSVFTEIAPQSGIDSSSVRINVNPQSIGYELREMLQSPKAIAFLERIFENLDNGETDKDLCDKFEDFLSKCPTAGVLDSISEFHDDFRQLWPDHMTLDEAAKYAISKIDDSEGCFWGNGVKIMKSDLLAAAHTAFDDEESLSSLQLDALVEDEWISESEADAVRPQSAPSM